MDHHMVQQRFAALTTAHLAELETVQAQRCLTLQAQPARVRAATLFRWWPLVA
jgi:hypothetical protein